MNWIQKIVAKIGMDKITHFFASAFLVLALGRFIHWLIPAAVVLGLGLSKELIDGNIDMKDLFADMLGVLLGVGILII